MMPSCRLVLTSRTGVRTGYQARCMHFWRRMGVKVVVSTRGINTLAETERLISDTQQQLGPIGGIFHLAVLLHDCLFESQTVDNFKESAATKYWGSKNLDAATRKLCGDELKWCVLHSNVY
jgi:fatty acid synthase